MASEPEWVVAQRDENRRSNNIWKGMFVGSALSALVFALVLSVERDVVMAFGGYVFAFVCMVSVWLAKRSESGSLMRPAAVTMGLLFAFAALIFLFGGGQA